MARPISKVASGYSRDIQYSRAPYDRSSVWMKKASHKADRYVGKKIVRQELTMAEIAV